MENVWNCRMYYNTSKHWPLSINIGSDCPVDLMFQKSFWNTKRKFLFTILKKFLINVKQISIYYLKKVFETRKTNFYLLI